MAEEEKPGWYIHSVSFAIHSPEPGNGIRLVNGVDVCLGYPRNEDKPPLGIVEKVLKEYCLYRYSGADEGNYDLIAETGNVIIRVRRTPFLDKVFTKYLHEWRKAHGVYVEQYEEAFQRAVGNLGLSEPPQPKIADVNDDSARTNNMADRWAKSYDIYLKRVHEAMAYPKPPLVRIHGFENFILAVYKENCIGNVPTRACFIASTKPEGC